MNEETIRDLAASMRAAAQAAKNYSPDTANAYDDCAERVERLIPVQVFTPPPPPPRAVPSEWTVEPTLGLPVLSDEGDG
jgi:hypothetical protein